MRFSFSLLITMLMLCSVAFSQADTSFIYNTTTPYGTLDIRLSKGVGHKYYFQHGKTFSFRENNGTPTHTFYKMTAWDSQAYTEGNMREATDSTDNFVMNYRLLVPKNYDPKLAMGYPIVVVMHGLHERGNCADSDCYFSTKDYSPNVNIPAAPKEGDHKLLNNDFQLVHAGLDYLEAHDVNEARLPGDPAAPAGAYPGFVLFPQNLNGWDAAASDDVIRLVRLVVREYNINADAVYLNGISHGGHGAYEVLKRAPWMFAAAVMFSAADDASLVSQKMADDIATVPLWIFQGGLDTNPSAERTSQYVTALRRAGAEVRYTVYPHLAHGTWNEALDEPDFFSWMLSKRRNNIHVQGGMASICSTSGEGARLQLPAGFVSYEWEYNGVTLENQNSDVLIANMPGSYRGRFLQLAGGDLLWSNWSGEISVSQTSLSAPLIEQVGTLLLPDLNGHPDATLRAIGQFANYYWYKDGRLINSRISDTSSTWNVKSRMGNGAYSLRVSGYDGCKSAESRVMHIRFNDSAPVNLSSPENVKVSVISASEVSLVWSDGSDGEVGFEIWRSTVGGDGNISPWILVGLTKENANTFVDRGLTPNANHLYKIRAVGHTRRSGYVPERRDDGIAIRTPQDLEKPSAPTGLSAAQAGVNAIRLTWSPAFDNSSVSNYIIVYNGESVTTASPDTAFVVTALDPNKDYAFQVTAVDQSGNISEGSNTALANTFLKGLYYQHSTGAWENIEMIDWSVAEYYGTVNDFILTPKTQEDFFNFMFDGFLNIEQRGVYQFRVTSDDGSVLFLNDSILVENDGIHNVSTVTSPVTILESGPQRITLRYFDYVLTDTLLVEFKGPDSGGEWSKIPPDALASSHITSNEVVMENQFDFSVYPNPVENGNAQVEFYSGMNLPVSIIIMTASGSIVYESLLETTSQSPFTLPVLPGNGMYIISVRQGTRMLNKKIISIR